MKHNPFLYFDFHNNPVSFQEPIRIVETYELNQVIPSLVEVQEAVDHGYYAAGFVSYEAAPAFDPSMEVHANSKIPLLWFGIYQEALPGKVHSYEAYETTEWKTQTDIHTYNNNIEKIKNAISQGDTYQVNYTIRMKSQFRGDPFSFYNQLSNLQSANYSAYLDLGTHQILSASPELFFHLKDKKITTKPMKGTIGRGRTAIEDQENADWLYHSEKNRAENVMIVDLLRNDLGVIAKPGTVRVPELFSIEKYPTVYQMTSTVTAEIDSDKKIFDVFKALFPCGSITGAPKISTMNIIKELETTPRKVYCGAIGYITPENEAIFNVPIRTVLIEENGNATYGVGGGITWDSVDQEEYAEVLTKAKVLTQRQREFQLIETLGLDNGSYLVLENHLNRLKNSAFYFNYSFNLNALKQELFELTKLYPDGFWKVRILLNKEGKTTTEITTEVKLKGSVKVGLARKPIHKANIFLYHKTTNRTVYKKSLREHPDCFDVLLWNENNEITEFSKGNVVVEIGGKLYTPPIRCGLLAGTYREALLQEGKISERVIRVDELDQCSSIWFINSVKEWVPVDLIRS